MVDYWGPPTCLGDFNPSPYWYRWPKSKLENMERRLLICALFLQSASNAAPTGEWRPNAPIGKVEYGAALGGYLSIDELSAFLDGFARDHPGLATEKRSIGTALQGRPIWSICAGACAGPDASAAPIAPAALFSSLIHAREPITLSALTLFLNTLAARRAATPPPEAARALLQTAVPRWRAQACRLLARTSHDRAARLAPTARRGHRIGSPTAGRARR